MAGDWIKMRADLFTHPKVVRITSTLKADTLRTVGGLMSAWCLFDAHSIDGRMDGYAPETLDEHLRWPGFAAAMIAVGWLEHDGESLALPEFEAHNGASAKRRAQDADRKRTVRNSSASKEDTLRTREEKRREEEKKELPRKRAPSKTVLPADFGISDRVRTWATEKGHNRLELHLESFRSKATAKGYTYADWDAALMEAIRENWAKLPTDAGNVIPLEQRPGGGRRAL